MKLIDLSNTDWGQWHVISRASNSKSGEAQWCGGLSLAHHYVGKIPLHAEPQQESSVHGKSTGHA